MNNGHASIFGHYNVVLELIDVPKALCMLLNNNHVNRTSEQSGRYTNTAEKCNESEQAKYNK